MGASAGGRAADGVAAMSQRAEIQAAVKAKMRQFVREHRDGGGMSPNEMRRAVYDIFADKHGVEAVGEFTHYQNKPPGYWTKERCVESALKFKTRTAWQRGEKGGWC